MPEEDIFSEESLLATMDVDLVRSMGAGLPAQLRFFQGVVEGVKNYLFGLDDTDSVSPFCVFLSEPPRIEGRACKRRPLFRQGQERLDGRTWFVSADVGSAHSVENVTSPLGDELVNFTDVDPDLAFAPVILVHRTRSDFTITFLPEGLDGSESKEYRLKDIHEPTSEEVRAKIELAYEEALRVVPSAHSSVRIWRSGLPKRPLPSPERTIQGYLRMALITAFPGCTAKEEQDTAAGRFDLALVSQRGNTISYHGLLELKVLQARSSGLKAVQKGLSQAFGYRDQLGASWARLMSFDVSQPLLGETIYDEIREEAASRDVELDYWPLYATPEAFRNATY